MCAFVMICLNVTLQIQFQSQRVRFCLHWFLTLAYLSTEYQQTWRWQLYLSITQALPLSIVDVLYLAGDRTGQLVLHRDSFTSALTIGQCVPVQRILFLKALREGNTARVSPLKLQRLCHGAVCGFCQGTRSVWD